MTRALMVWHWLFKEKIERMTDTVFSTGELIALLIGVIASSGIAGFLAGFLGVGGGIVIVPVLFWLFTFVQFPDALSLHMAVATSLATIIFTSISSVRTHHQKGGVDLVLLKRWAVTLGLGALCGGLASRYIDPWGLKVIFGVIALLVAVNFATPKTLVIADKLPSSHVFNLGISYIIGVVSSLMGIGGGTLSVPILAAFSYPIKKAVGTAAAFGFIIALPAVAGFIFAGSGVEGRPPYSLGYVNFVAVLVIIPFTMAVAPFGARLAQSVDPLWVKRGFAVFLAITAVRMLYSLI